MDRHEKENSLMADLNRLSHVKTEFLGEEAAALLDWDYIYRTACKLGGAPILYHHLKSLPPEVQTEIPAMSVLRAQYHLVSASNLHLLHEYDRIAEKLWAAGIRCIGFKGAALARLLYPTPGLRPMFDIDLLVPEEDLEGVAEVVAALGYGLPEGQTCRRSRPYDYHLHYLRKGPAPVYLEIHWRLGEQNRYNMDLQGVWERAAASPWGPSLIMSDDDTFLYLCQHFFKHFLFKRLSWLCDIYEWIARKPIDWKRVIERARSQGMATYLAYTLTIVGNFYSMELPVEPKRVLKIGRLRKRILDRYLDTYDMFSPMEKNSWPEKRLFAFCAIDRLDNRLRFTLDAFKRDLA
ncbi:MAG: nucleotidyltransferase family protein [bacterium]|nr:nucleotidyltransferase family protein [bacterium]